MPRIDRIVIGSLALAVLASPAAAEQASPYFVYGLGASFLEGLSVTGPNGAGASLNENVGILGTAGLGYAFGNGFRTEFEFGYRMNDAKNVTLPGGGNTPTALNLKANAAALSYMVNGIYGFKWGSPWMPYIGFGVGAANVRVNNLGHETPFAWQAMAGVEYPLTQRWVVGVGYKYLATEDLNLHNPYIGVASHGAYQDHAALLTLRWKFGIAPPPVRPAAVMPPAPPPAPPPPQTRSYTVYFAFNSATLDQPARQVVAAAASAALQGGLTHVGITGHTDTVGSGRYNMALSERRAQAVRQELITLGVPAEQIATDARGEGELAVPTAQNVNEPRNRRAVIIETGPGS